MLIRLALLLVGPMLGSLAAAEAAPGAAPPEDIEPHVVAYPDPPDPLEPLNRAVFGFNHVTYRYLLVPVSRGYLEHVPEPARRSLGNFFANLKMPIDLVNHLAQLDARGAGRDLARFGVNTTVGLLGFRDPATERFGIEADPTGFRDTLAHYGADHGPYLTLPFVGASDVRSGLGLLADWMVNPIRFLTDYPTTLGVQSADYLQLNAQRADAYPELYEESKDPYVFFRDLHLESVQRDADYP